MIKVFHSHLTSMDHNRKLLLIIPINNSLIFANYDFTSSADVRVE